MKLTYERQSELRERGQILCPYVRNPTECRGSCALTNRCNDCRTPFKEDYKTCRNYRERLG